MSDRRKIFEGNPFDGTKTYVKIKRFVYKNEDLKKLWNNRPKRGDVLRCYKHSDEEGDIYVIDMRHEGKSLSGIVVPELKGEAPNWEHEIVEVTKDNFADVLTEKETSKYIKLLEEDDGMEFDFSELDLTLPEDVRTDDVQEEEAKGPVIEFTPETLADTIKNISESGIIEESIAMMDRVHLDPIYGNIANTAVIVSEVNNYLMSGNSQHLLHILKATFTEINRRRNG